ncbi:hypothetical protein PF002_g30833, partial [Phytophthora fragariae]
MLQLWLSRRMSQGIMSLFVLGTRASWCLEVGRAVHRHGYGQASDELRIEELGFVENRALRKTASTKLPLFGLVLLKYASNEL